MPGIDYTLGMKTGAFSSGLKSAMGGLADLGKKAAMLTATAGLAAGVGVGAAIAKGISSASRIETLETAFAPLLGGMAKARERMEELSKFAAATPFELPGIAQASKALEKPTSGLLSTGEGLRMVGDAAAYAQRPIEDVAGYVGQLYAALEGGGELGEGLQQLTELGIISYNAKNQISELNKTAGGGKAAWEIARREMESFTGSMEMLSITWNGKLSTLGDAIDQVFAKFGKPVMDSLKPYLDRLTTTIEGMEPMAQRVGTAIGDALDTAFSAWEEGKIFAFLGAGMKLAFIDAVNTLARLLQATVAGAMAGFEISGLLLAIDATFTGVAMKLKSAMSESLADFAETIGRFGVAKDLRKKAADESTAGGQAFGISKQALGTFNADTAAFAFQKKFKERMASDEAPLIDRSNAAADYEAIKAATAARTAQIRAGVPEPTLANSADVALAEANAAADATAKSTAAQAAAIQRSNHTGTQAWSTITSTPTTLSGYGIGDAVASTLLSTSGGANKVPQYAASGNLYTGPLDNRLAGVYLSSGFGSVGNIYIPDQQGLLWRDPATGANIFSIRHWRGHDAISGEALIESSWRIALLAQGPVQFGLNDAARSAQCLHLTSGASSALDTIKHSKAISWQAKRYNGGSEQTGYVTAQATSLSSSGDGTVLRFAIAENPVNGPIEGFNGGGGQYTKDISVGTNMAEFSANGIWHPGGAPAFDTLTDGATITQTCSKYKTTQNAKVTLGGNRTLAISGALAGMRGTIFASQDSTGSRTIALPTNSSTVPGFALSTTALKTDRLTWEYDGTYFYWSILAGLDLPTDSDASAFFTAATLTDPTQKSAVNTLVIQLKAAGFWSKASAIYPFVGGNATAHSKDLKASYNITWTGVGVTHDANGITGNGSTAYGNTGLAPSAIGADNNSLMMAVYCKTATPTDNGTFMGALTSGVGRSAIGHHKPGGTAYFSISGINGATSDIKSANLSANLQSLLTGSRTGASAQFLRGRGVTISDTTASTGRATVPFFILARNNATVADKFTNANLAFAMLGTGFTEAEVIQLESIITTYQTTLSRANP